MFSSETDDQYMGKILKELNSGKSFRSLLLEISWTERAKLLSKIKQLRKYQEAFLEEVAKD